MEHLLRDVKDSTISTLSSEVGDMVAGLRGLKSRLLEVKEYLGAVLAGRLPVNHDIMGSLQAREGGSGWRSGLPGSPCLPAALPGELRACPQRPAHEWCHLPAVQDIFNLLPNLNVAELSKSFAVESNDMMLVIYVASLIRSVIALHNLIDNKEHRALTEREHEKVGGRPAAGRRRGLWAVHALGAINRLNAPCLELCSASPVIGCSLPRLCRS